jgi:hypothetical protein
MSNGIPHRLASSKVIAISEISPTTKAAASNSGKTNTCCDDNLLETAQLLLDISIKTLMAMHHVDRETARYFLLDAFDGL